MTHPILRLLAAILICALAGACSESHRIKIGVSQCSSDDWRSKMNDEILREAMFQGNVDVEIRSADDDNERQIADIRYFADNGFDIILAAPNEAEALAPVIEETYVRGVPVLVFDREVATDKYTAFQGADNRGIGRAAAAYAAALTGARGSVLEIHGLAASGPARGRHRGFAEAVDSLYPGMNIANTVYADWNYEDAARLADSLFDAGLRPDIVYAHNDRMALAARAAADRHGLHPYIIGVDAAPEIGIRAVADSVIDATFLYPTDGHRLVSTALAIVEGEPFDTVSILPVPSAVDLSNADILLMQDASMQEETRRMRTLKGQVDTYIAQYSSQKIILFSTLAILFLLVVLTFLILKAYWQRKNYQTELEAQNLELARQRDLQKSLNEQLAEATRSKLRFYTNVSHDLRTPLTLIAEPVAQIAKATNLTDRQKTLAGIADKNVNILRRLINQILDFHKYENGLLDVHMTEARPGALLAEWADAFRPVALKRDMTLKTDIGLPADFAMALDVEKTERIIFNLISNAFKYTPDNGTITVGAKLEDNRLVITVADSGRGISDDDIHHIFDRFFQVDKVHPNGSGIGLSLSKAFVDLLNGSITVASRPGQGSTFTVSLPVSHCAPQAAEHIPVRAVSDEEIKSALAPVEKEDLNFSKDLPLLLVIDDNADIRTLISDLLGDAYNVLEADGGTEGIRMAAKYVPDLIICDVMMPGIDGFQTCAAIKAETSTSHIPVLMLTACNADAERALGYEAGADSYLAKPFSDHVLRTRCQNLLDNRRRIKELWTTGNHTTEKTAAPLPESTDTENEFYARFLEIFRAGMGDPDLSVDTLASQMGLGRSQFYRKIKALTNYSPVELIRKLRLQAARGMLTSTTDSISEIAYAVGFSTPAYFTKCYREAYGETPSELRDRLNIG